MSQAARHSGRRSPTGDSSVRTTSVGYRTKHVSSNRCSPQWLKFRRLCSQEICALPRSVSSCRMNSDTSLTHRIYVKSIVLRYDGRKSQQRSMKKLDIERWCGTGSDGGVVVVEVDARA